MRHCAGFISAESLYMFRASSAHHQEYLKLVQRPLVHVLSLQVSHHISLLGPAGILKSRIGGCLDHRDGLDVLEK